MNRVLALLFEERLRKCFMPATYFPDMAVAKKMWQQSVGGARGTFALDKDFAIHQPTICLFRAS